LDNNNITTNPWHRKALKSSYFLGLGHAINDAMIYFLCAAVFRLGAFQITLDESHALHREFDDIFT